MSLFFSFNIVNLNFCIIISKVYLHSLYQFVSLCGLYNFVAQSHSTSGTVDLPSTSLLMDAQSLKPSEEGWTSTQCITIANLKHRITLSDPKDTTKELTQKCSMKKIQKFKTELSNRSEKNECNSNKNDIENSKHNLTDKKSSSIEDAMGYEPSNIKTSKNRDVNKEIKDATNFLQEINLKEVDKESCQNDLEEKENIEVVNGSEPLQIKTLSIDKDVNTTLEEIKDASNTFEINIRERDEKIFKHNLEDKENIEFTNDSKPSNIRKKNREALMIEVKGSSNITSDSNKLSFMASLQDGADITKLHSNAVKFVVLFVFERKKLTQQLFKEFNSLVFYNKLDEDMPIVWSTRIWSTAGITTLKLVTSPDGTEVRQSSIKLSFEVVNTPQRLRDVLIHELCHSAAWLIDGKFKSGHGEYWKKWVNRALEVIPELGEISRLHDYDINYKYIYKCVTCPGSYKRRTKQKNKVEYCCRRCQGRLQLLVSPQISSSSDIKRHSLENIFSVIARIINDLKNT